VIDVAQSAESPLVARMQRMAGIGGWEVDLRTRAVTWTSETYRIHEVIPACFAPTLESAIDFYVTEHLPLLRRALANAVESATAFDLELEMITARGRRLWVRAIGQVQVRAGRARRLFGLIQDITERRRLEREILDIARYDRERAVRGLHDDLGQALTGMSLMLRRGTTLVLAVSGDCISVQTLESSAAADLSVLRRRAKLSGATLEVLARRRARALLRCTLRVLRSPAPQLAEEASLC
jgi:signal transduction histidine kinase